MDSLGLLFVLFICLFYYSIKSNTKVFRTVLTKNIIRSSDSQEPCSFWSKVFLEIGRFLDDHRILDVF